MGAHAGPACSLLNIGQNLPTIQEDARVAQAACSNPDISNPHILFCNKTLICVLLVEQSKATGEGNI